MQQLTRQGMHTQDYTRLALEATRCGCAEYCINPTNKQGLLPMPRVVLLRVIFYVQYIGLGAARLAASALNVRSLSLYHFAMTSIERML